MGIALPGKNSPVSPHPEPLNDVFHFSLNSWEQMAQGLSSGEINAAFINIPLAMDLFEKGLDIALVMFTHRGGSRMICPPDDNQRGGRIPDFKGKSILIPHPLSIQHMLLHKFLDAKGIRLSTSPCPETVCAEAVPPFLMPEMTARDKARDIAGFVCEAPFGAPAVEQGQARQLLATRDLWPDHPCSAFVVRRNLVENQTQEIEALVGALFRSAAKLNAGIGRGDHTLLADAAAFLKHPEHLLAKDLKSSGATYAPELLTPDLTILNIIQKYVGQTMGLLSGTIDLEAFVRPEFSRKALEELDT